MPSPNSRPKSSGRPRSLDAHRAMLEATLALLSEGGFDAVSMEAVATKAKVSKTTIYRRYSSKELLVADALESVREEVDIPNTGSLAGDLDAIIDQAAKLTFTPLGQQAMAMILSSAARYHWFAHIYRTHYLEPRRKTFAVVIERAKVRQEMATAVDADLVFDVMSGIMLYAVIFPPPNESWVDYVRRALSLVIGDPCPVSAMGSPLV